MSARRPPKQPPAPPTEEEIEDAARAFEDVAVRIRKGGIGYVTASWSRKRPDTVSIQVTSAPGVDVRDVIGPEKTAALGLPPIVAPAPGEAERVIEVGLASAAPEAEWTRAHHPGAEHAPDAATFMGGYGGDQGINGLVLGLSPGVEVAVYEGHTVTGRVTTAAPTHVATRPQEHDFNDAGICRRCAMPVSCGYTADPRYACRRCAACLGAFADPSRE